MMIVGESFLLESSDDFYQRQQISCLSAPPGRGYIGKCYGFMLTAWACAGIAGPLVFAQLTRSTALYVAAGLLVVGFFIALAYQRPDLKKVKVK